MKKILFTLFLLVPLLSFSTIRQVIPPCSGNDITANLQTQINACNNGDSIMLPSSQYVLTGRITINKQITIGGLGSTNTMLYRDGAVSDATLESWNSMFYVTSPNVKIYGIHFKSKRPSIVNGDGYSLAIDTGIEFEYGSIGFKVLNCKFENFGHSGVKVFHYDTDANGLISNSQFYHNAKGSDGQGYGYGVTVFGEGITWIADPRLGSSHFIFIEKCTFDYHRHAIASGGGALYVARYNTIRANIIGGPYQHAIDTHEARGPGNSINTTGSRATEIYNNIIINNIFVNTNPLQPNKPVTNVEEKAIAVRSGDLVIFNNTISGFRFGIGILNLYQSQPENVTAYYWNNTFTQYIASPSASTAEFYNYHPSYYQGGRDYFNIAKPGYIPYTYPRP